MKCAQHSGFLVLLVIVSSAAGSPANADDPKLEESRALAKTFGMRLKAELKKGLEEGGPLQAVSVCKDIAPRIASELSRQSGANVARTSLRFRNPANAPEPWQAQVLRDFEGQTGNGESAGSLEYFSRQDDGTIRYMKGIRTEGVCLVCHGASIPLDLEKRIDFEYPHDRAVGYALGDVRGAFSLTWPAPDKHPGS